MHNFKELKIWQRSRALVKEIYKITDKFPEHERFGLISQIQRAVVSIPLNIAEGSGRSSTKDFSRFLEMALTSSFELETLMILSSDLEYITDEDLQKISTEVLEIQRMIYSFRKNLKD